MHGPPPKRPLRRNWHTALALALLAVYLPTATPFLSGHILESRHSYTTYLAFLPIVPAWPLAFSFRQSLIGTWLAGGIGSATLLAVAFQIARCLRGPHLFAGHLPFFVLIGIECHLLGTILRA